jgi:hypothetical protein
VPFDQLVPAWQLANYLDDLGGFVPSDTRLRYSSINLRTSLASLWPSFPLDPDSVGATGYRRDGVLRAGSGRHLRVALAAGGPSTGFRLTGSSGGVPAPLLAVRIGVARVR